MYEFKELGLESAGSLGSVALGFGDSDNGVGSLLVDCLQLLDLAQRFHSENYSAKNHILVVEEGQRCTHSNVELRLIGVLNTAALAHAQQADLCVLNVEGLVGEFSLVDRGLFVVENATGLDEHSRDNSVDFTTFVGHHVALCGFSKSLAEGHEVRTSLRGNIAK